ncbi:MAG: hypothetical protein N2654_06820, partial [Deltaproteobacteria bacterium]|nr:hypothetical protein [Deltaproteobacteria bacterium]
ITPIAFDLRIHLPVLKSVHSFGDKMSSKAMNTALIWSEILGVKDITFVLAFDEPLNQFYFKAPLRPVKFLFKLFDQEDKIEEVEEKGYVEKKFTDIDLVFSIKDGFIEVSNKNRTIDNLQTYSGLYLEFDTSRLPPTNGALGREILKNYPELTQAEKNSDAIFETVNKIFSIRKSQIFLSFKETDKSVYFDAENSYCKLS